MPFNLRAQIALNLVKVMDEGLSLNAVNADLHQQIDQARDLAFARECLFGCTRHIEKLQWIASQLLQKPIKSKEYEVKALLLSALYQLYFLHVPDHAIISETVNAIRQLKKDWACKLINGVLRNAVRRKSELMEVSSQSKTAKFAMPEWLLKRLKNAWSKQWQSICEQSNHKAPLILRANQSHPQYAQFPELFNNAEIHFEQHPTVPSAIKLEKALPVLSIPEFDSGLFSVQDLSAQLAAYLLPISAGDKVLDACAAPGGKTAHLLEKNPEIGLVALDNQERRARRITENLMRMNLKCEVVIDDATSYQSKNTLDAILVDAPCSATGVIRRQPDIKIHRRDDDIYPTVKLQRAILDNLWPQLKQGGFLLYATCSVLPDENQKQIKRFIADYSDATIVNFDEKYYSLGLNTGFGMQIFPQHWHDGFFYCLLQKS